MPLSNTFSNSEPVPTPKLGDYVSLLFDYIDYDDDYTDYALHRPKVQVPAGSIGRVHIIRSGWIGIKIIGEVMDTLYVAPDGLRILTPLELLAMSATE